MSNYINSIRELFVITTWFKTDNDSRFMSSISETKLQGDWNSNFLSQVEQKLFRS